jgi:ribokinase
MAAAICVVGSLNMDLVVSAPRLPGPGETLAGGPFATYPGGKGANQAVAARRLGGEVAMVGRVGADAFGAELRDGLAAEGVDVAAVAALDNLASGIALITVAQGGQNTIVIAPGANGALSPEAVEGARDVIAGCRVLVLQLETPLPAVQRAAELAREAGALVLLNPAPAQPLPSELLALVDYLVPNQGEAALLSGVDAPDRPGALKAAEQLWALGARGVVVTLGDAGALLFHGAGSEFVEPHDVEAVDATAAGDAFVGAFAVALAEGRPPAEALRWGNAAGAIAVTRPGAQPSLPTRAEVEALLQ